MHPSPAAALHALAPALAAGLASLLAVAAGCSSGAADAGPPVRIQVDVGDAPVKGPDDAPVTIVEFADFECPYCGEEQPVLARLLTAYEGRVRLAFKQFPLPFHAHAALAAEAALAAHAQGQFWPYQDALWAHQSALGRDALEYYAADVGLDMDAFRAALDAGTCRAAVEADVTQGQLVGVGGTPTFFVNGLMVVGAVPYQDLADVVEQELAIAASPDAGVDGGDDAGVAP